MRLLLDANYTSKNVLLNILLMFLLLQLVYSTLSLGGSFERANF